MKKNIKYTIIALTISLLSVTGCSKKTTEVSDISGGQSEKSNVEAEAEVVTEPKMTEENKYADYLMEYIENLSDEINILYTSLEGVLSKELDITKFDENMTQLLKMLGEFQYNGVPKTYVEKDEDIKKILNNMKKSYTYIQDTLKKDTKNSEMDVEKIQSELQKEIDGMGIELESLMSTVFEIMSENSQ